MAPEMGSAPVDDLAPLYVLAGARASGKTTLRPLLVRAAQGPIVMEMDEILEDGALPGAPTVEDITSIVELLWVRTVTVVRRSGHPVILLCPTPSPDTFPPDSSLVPPPVRWARLDCSDRTRRARLREQGWNDDEIEDFLTDAGHRRIRAMIPTVFHTDSEDASSLAARVLNWVAAGGTA